MKVLQEAIRKVTIVKLSMQPSPPSPEVREKALELLRSKGGAARRKVERLLGWEGPGCMMQFQMAELLGVTKWQLNYILDRDYLRAKRKAERTAERDAKKIAFVTHISHKLQFSVALPEDWCVITDTHEWSWLAQEYLEYVRKSKPGKKPTRLLAYSRRSANIPMRPSTEFEERLAAKEEYEVLKAKAEQHARLESMATGLFQAEPADHTDDAFVEVTKLQLDSPLTALDLYELDKCLPEDVSWGNRPKNGMVVDGLSGVVYYYLMRHDHASQDEPVFFNVYLADGLEGWIISCQCRYADSYKTFRKYKPIFRHIIRSFKRLRIVRAEGPQA